MNNMSIQAINSDSSDLVNDLQALEKKLVLPPVTSTDRGKEKKEKFIEVKERFDLIHKKFYSEKVKILEALSNQDLSTAEALFTNLKQSISGLDGVLSTITSIIAN